MTLPLRTNEVKGVKLLVRFCQKTLASKKGIQNWSFEVNISDSDRSWPYLSLCLSARLHMFAPQESAFFARFLTRQIWTHNFCLKLFERLISREPVVLHRFYPYLGFLWFLWTNGIALVKCFSRNILFVENLSNKLNSMILEVFYT